MSADVGCIPLVSSIHRLAAPLIAPFAVVLAIAAVALGIDELKAQTLTPDAPSTTAPWCLQRNANEPPICSYDNFPSCFIAGFREGGSCVSNPGPAAAGTQQPADQAARRRVARSTSGQQSGAQPPAASAQNGQPARKRKQLTDAERDQLFKDFQRWREQRAETKDSR